MNKEDLPVVNGITFVAAEREIGEKDYGNKDNDLVPGLVIETKAYDNEVYFDEKTGNGYRIVAGKKVKANSEILKKVYEARNKRAKQNEENQR